MKWASSLRRRIAFVLMAALLATACGSDDSSDASQAVATPQVTVRPTVNCWWDAGDDTSSPGLQCGTSRPPGANRVIAQLTPEERSTTVRTELAGLEDFSRADWDDIVRTAGDDAFIVIGDDAFRRQAKTWATSAGLGADVVDNLLRAPPLNRVPVCRLKTAGKIPYVICT